MPTIKVNNPKVVPQVVEKVYDGVSPVRVTTSVREVGGQDIYSASVVCAYTNDNERNSENLPEVCIDDIQAFGLTLDDSVKSEFFQLLQVFITTQLRMVEIVLQKREII